MKWFLKDCSCNLFFLLSYMLIIHCLPPKGTHMQPLGFGGSTSVLYFKFGKIFFVKLLIMHRRNSIHSYELRWEGGVVTNGSDPPDCCRAGVSMRTCGIFNCSQTKFVAIILVLPVFFNAIFRLTDFSSDAFDF